MSTTYVPAAIRRLVFARSGGICEYCLIACEDTFLGCCIEHIISEKHGGATVAENLAISCIICNRYKGSDISSLSEGGNLCRLFNPRVDRWRDHFILDKDMIRPLTEIGEATIRLLNANEVSSVIERRVLRELGSFPTDAARKIIE